MKVEVTESGTLALSEFFDGLILRTTEGFQIGICPREDTFEINVGGRWFRVNILGQEILPMGETYDAQ